MFLEYGVNEHGELISVDAVARGRTALKCPYCNAPLLAKKGLIKQHHLAHDGETCAAATSDNASLPAYDQFDLHIPAKVLADLKRFTRDDDYGVRYWKLREYDLIAPNYKGNFELTKKGKIPLGQLSLSLFIQYQDAAFMERHEVLEAEARRLKQSPYADTPGFQSALTDLRLYRAQWRRLLTCTLYFIEVSHTSKEWGAPFYKIGVTTRDIAARCAEIEQDLRPHIGPVTLKVLDLWPHRGSIEFYFKHRYQKHQRRLGPLTEYFLFKDIRPVLSYDLRRMPDKALTPFEIDIVSGRGAAIEQEIEADAIEARRRAAIVKGMKRAQTRGHAIGRPRGLEDVAAFLAKDTTQAAIAALNAGLSIREAARVTNLSTATIQKVRRAISAVQADEE